MGCMKHNFQLSDPCPLCYPSAYNIPRGSITAKPEEADAPKNDQGKARYDLIPAHALEALAKVYMNGAGAEYPENSWRKGFRYTRIFSAAMRHLWAWMRGEELDPKTRLPHTIHAAWNCFTLFEMGRTGKGTDDRWKEEI